MSAELALVSGLGILGYILIQISQKFEDAETQVNQGIFTLSVLFMIGLEYTAYGIAQSQGFANAEIAYLVALFITGISFLGLLARFVQSVLDKAGDDDVMEDL